MQGHVIVVVHLTGDKIRPVADQRCRSGGSEAHIDLPLTIAHFLVCSLSLPGMLILSSQVRRRDAVAFWS